MRDGRQVVARAGTSVPLTATSVAGGIVTFAAEDSNTGVVVLGGPDVVAAAATRRGIPLYPDPTRGATTHTMRVDDLQSIHLDAEQAGDGVTYLIS